MIGRQTKIRSPFPNAQIEDQLTEREDDEDDDEFGEKNTHVPLLPGGTPRPASYQRGNNHHGREFEERILEEDDEG